MYETPFRETNPPNQSSYGPRPYHCGPGRGMLRTVLMWTAVALLVVFAFGTVTWALGLVFHLAGLLLRIALITAVVAFVWRRITRRHQRNSGV